MRLLFVENNLVFARTTAQQFLSGFEVTYAPALADARRAAGEETFDVMLVDYELDDGAGDVLVRELRAAFRGPIIAVSALEEGNARLLAAGADVSCRKSDFRGIAAVVAAALSRRS